MMSKTEKILKELRDEMFSEVVFYKLQIEMRDFTELSQEEYQDRINFLTEKINLIDIEFRS